MEAVERWLAELGLEKYAPVFREQEIDMEALAGLTESDLRELGLPIGPRKKVLQNIKHLGGEVAVFRSRGAERRQLSVVFCDLVGSTDLAKRLDPEEMREVLARFHGCCREAVESRGGSISQYLGDGVLAFFGYPEAHEDDAARAVDAALEIAERTPALSPGAGAPMSMRAGIDTGEVVVGVDRGGAPMAVGDTMNFAARLQSLAEANGVAISDRTRALTGGRFAYEDGGFCEIRGFGREQVWRAARRAAASDPLERDAVDRAAFVGREAEIALLREAWEAASGGAAQAVLISGDAGMGKSRLLRHFKTEIAGEAPERLALYGAAQFARTPYRPFIDLLRDRFAIPRGAGDGALIEKVTEGLACFGVDGDDHIAAVAAILKLDDGRPDGEDRREPEDLRAAFLTAIMKLLGAMARQRPLWLVIEDLHWLDPSSQELAGRLIACADDHRALITVTTRERFPDDWSDQGNVRRLALRPFELPAATEIVRSLTGGRTLPKGFVEQIMEKADGVPLFVEELAQSAFDMGLVTIEGDRVVAVGGEIAIPRTLRATLAARLDRIGRGKRIAQIGSVIGRVFSHNMILAAAGAPEGELILQLRALVEAGVLIARGVPPDAEYRFKHALIHDAAYESMLREDRRRVHLDVSAILELGEAGTAPFEVVAGHLARGEDHARAAPYWERAGRQALARSAHVEAIAFFDEALACARGLADAVYSPPARVSLLLALCDALAATGGFDRARRILREAEAAAGRIEDPRLDATVRVHICFIDCQRGDLAAACEAGEAALAIAEEVDDDSLVVAASYALGEACQYAGEVRRAATLLEAALPRLKGPLRSERFGPTGATAVSFLATLSITCALNGAFEDARTYGEEACDVARDAGQAYGLGLALNALAIAHLDRGEIPEAKEHLDTGMEVWRRHDARLLFPMVGSELGLCLAFAGKREAARRILSEALEKSRDAETPFYAAYAEGNLALSCLREGEHEAALAHGASALEAARRAGFTLVEIIALRAIGAATVATGDVAAGIEMLHEALSIAESHGLDPQAARTRLRLAEALSAAGYAEDASAEATAAAAYFRASGMRYWLPACEAVRRAA